HGQREIAQILDRCAVGQGEVSPRDRGRDLVAAHPGLRDAEGPGKGLVGKPRRRESQADRHPGAEARLGRRYARQGDRSVDRLAGCEDAVVEDLGYRVGTRGGGEAAARADRAWRRGRQPGTVLLAYPRDLLSEKPGQPERAPLRAGSLRIQRKEEVILLHPLRELRA